MPREERRTYFSANTTAPEASTAYPPRRFDTPARTASPARFDTPRANTPANAPRHFSQTQYTSTRQATPARVSEIHPGVEEDAPLSDHDSDEDDEEYEDAQPHFSAPATPRAKDHA